jgi:L,D-transpeptidase catalytic domain
MGYRKYLGNVLLGTAAVGVAGAHLVPRSDETGPVMRAAVSFVSPKPITDSGVTARASSPLSASITNALAALAQTVHPLSHPRALEDAFRSYFAYKAAHPEDVKKPYLYFVDYGLPATVPRGYVFDMKAHTIVDGPFTVAHGRGSSTSHYGVPTRFANIMGAATSSLGLYVAQETYEFRGHSAGREYGSIGMRLMGVSGNFNDKARARGVVAHGAPYVTPAKAGRSEGCPAMEQSRASKLLPKLANGGLVFLFAPDSTWMSRDPWVAAGVE